MTPIIISHGVHFTSLQLPDLREFQQDKQDVAACRGIRAALRALAPQLTPRTVRRVATSMLSVRVFIVSPISTLLSPPVHVLTLSVLQELITSICSDFIYVALCA